MTSTEGFIALEEMSRPETSQCSRMGRNNMNKTITNFLPESALKNGETSRDKMSDTMKNFRKMGDNSNDISGGDSKEGDIMSATGQGFHKRQNSGNFQQGLTLDQYFGANFKIIANLNTQEDPSKTSQQTQNPQSTTSSSSNSAGQRDAYNQNQTKKSKSGNAGDGNYQENQKEYRDEAFEIHQTDEQYSESNRGSRADLSSGEAQKQITSSKQEQREGRTRDKVIFDVDAQIQQALNNNNDELSVEGRDDRITKKLRDKYSQKHQIFNTSNVVNNSSNSTTNTSTSNAGKDREKQPGVGGSGGGGISGTNSSSNSQNGQKLQNIINRDPSSTATGWKSNQNNLGNTSFEEEGNEYSNEHGYSQQQQQHVKSFQIRKINNNNLNSNNSPNNQMVMLQHQQNIMNNQNNVNGNSQAQHLQPSNHLPTTNSQSSLPTEVKNINEQILTRTQYGENFIGGGIGKETHQKQVIQNHIAFRNSFYGNDHFLKGNPVLAPSNNSLFNGNSKNRLTLNQFYKNQSKFNGFAEFQAQQSTIGDLGIDAIMRKTAKENQFLNQKEKISELVVKEDVNFITKYAAHFGLNQDECKQYLQFLIKIHFTYNSAPFLSLSSSSLPSPGNDLIKNFPKGQINNSNILSEMLESHNQTKRLETPNKGFQPDFQGTQTNFKSNNTSTSTNHNNQSNNNNNLNNNINNNNNNAVNYNAAKESTVSRSARRKDHVHNFNDNPQTSSSQPNGNIQ